MEFSVFQNSLLNLGFQCGNRNYMHSVPLTANLAISVIILLSSNNEL